MRTFLTIVRLLLFRGREHRYELRLPDGVVTYPLWTSDSITIRDIDGEPMIVIYQASSRETWVTVLAQSEDEWSR